MVFIRFAFFPAVAHVEREWRRRAQLDEERLDAGRDVRRRRARHRRYGRRDDRDQMQFHSLFQQMFNAQIS